MKQNLPPSSLGRSGSVEGPDQEAKMQRYEKSNTADLDEASKGKKSSSEAYLDKEENMDPSQVLNQNRVYLWAILLKNNELKNELIKNDQDIIQVSLDLPNQRVIKTDCLRTRNNIFKDSNLKENLEILLTYYCKQHKISYKQGLNEVAAPMIFFHKINVTMANIYNYFKLFIDRFLPNLFHDDEFLSLQCCFRVFNLLIQYHDPYLSQFLLRNDIAPELFATPWFITLFASKMSLDVLYLFWDIYIIENDPFFIFFFALSLLIVNKKRLVNIDSSMVPQSLTRLTVNSEQELKKIYKRAVELKTSTPESFLLKMKELEIFKKNYKDDETSRKKMFLNTYLLEEFICLTLKPLELIKNTYSGQITCSNIDCVTIKNLPRKKADTSREGALSDSELEITKVRDIEFDASLSKGNQRSMNEEFKTGSNKSEETCIICHSQKNKISPDLMVFTKRIKHLKELIEIGNEVRTKKTMLNFLTIDLRKDKSNGVLAKSQLININQFNNDITNNLINDLIEFKGKYHFCFIISEMNFMQENLKEKQMNQRNEKFYTQADEDSAYIDEEIILKKFIKDFIENGFPYISLIDGGFKDLHNIYRGLEFEIINHDSKKCTLCKKNSKKNQSVSFLDFFIKVFNKPASGKQKEEPQETMKSTKPQKSSLVLADKNPEFRNSSQKGSGEEKQRKIFKEDPEERVSTTSSFINCNNNKENIGNVAKIFLHQSAENEVESRSISHEFRESLIRTEAANIYSSTIPNSNRIQSSSIKEVMSPLQEHNEKRIRQDCEIHAQNENYFRGSHTKPQYNSFVGEPKPISTQTMSLSYFYDKSNQPLQRGVGQPQHEMPIRLGNETMSNTLRPKPNVFDFSKRQFEGETVPFSGTHALKTSEISEKSQAELFNEKLSVNRKSLSPNHESALLNSRKESKNPLTCFAEVSGGGGSLLQTGERAKNQVVLNRAVECLKEVVPTVPTQISPKPINSNKNKKRVEEEFRKLSELNNYDSPNKQQSRDFKAPQKSIRECSPKALSKSKFEDSGRYQNQSSNYSPSCSNNSLIKAPADPSLKFKNQRSYDKTNYNYDKSPSKGEFSNKENSLIGLPAVSTNSSIFRFEGGPSAPGVFSMALSSIDSVFNYYSTNGIISEFRVPRSEWEDFLMIFFNYKFHFYVCGDVSDGVTTNDTSAYPSMNRDTRKRILVISSEYVLSFLYDPTLESIFKYIIELNASLGSDATAGGHARKHSKNKMTSSDREIKKHTLERDAPNILNDQIQRKKLSSFIQNKCSEPLLDCFVVKAIYYMKMLLKITSKKFNSNILSFYFKIPERNIDEQTDENYLKKLIMSNVNQFSSFYSSINSDKKNDGDSIKKKKLESKCLFDLSDETLAKECIKKTKDLYTQCIQNSGKHKK